LKKLNIDDLVHFDFLDPPAPETLMRALELLNYLGALDEEGDMTLEGQKMAEFPLDPQLAKMLISSPKYMCSADALKLVSLLSVPQIFLRPKDQSRNADEAKAQFAHMDGDHLSLLNAFHGYTRALNQGYGDPKHYCDENYLNQRALKSTDDVRRQLHQIMDRMEIPICSVPRHHPDFDTNLRRALVAGFFTQIAFLQKNGQYVTLRDNQVVSIHPSSVLNHKPEWLVYDELVLTTKSYVRCVTQIRGEWMLEAHKEYFELDNFPRCEATKALGLLWKQHKNEGAYGYGRW